MDVVMRLVAVLVIVATIVVIAVQDIPDDTDNFVALFTYGYFFGVLAVSAAVLAGV